MKLLVMAMLMVTPATSMEMVAESPKPDTTVVTDGQANREISGEKTICQDRVHQAESDDFGRHTELRNRFRRSAAADRCGRLPTERMQHDDDAQQYR